MTNHSHGAALFDIDGTLVDSNYLHVEAWSHAFAEAGEPVDAWRIHRSIGMDGDALLKSLLGDDVDTVGERAKELHTEYFQTLQPRLRTFAGARELLRELARRGATVVLATSAPEDELAALRGVLDIEDAVAKVTSSADVEVAKPRPDILEAALRKADATAERSVLVGDAVWDVESAHRAGIDCIGVLTGGTSLAELRDAGAVAVYESVDELLRRLDDSPLARLLG